MFDIHINTKFENEVISKKNLYDKGFGDESSRAALFFEGPFEFVSCVCVQMFLWSACLVGR